MLNIDVSGDVISAILFLLIASFAVLLYIAFLIKNLKITGGTERIIEKHYSSSKKKADKESPDEEESEDERRQRVQRDIDLDNKWGKNVESKVSGIGKKEIVDGKSSMDAVNLMRDMEQGKKPENNDE